MCNMGDLDQIHSEKQCCVVYTNNKSEQPNVKACSLNKSQQKKHSLFKSERSTSFEYVGDEFFSLDDGMMMQFLSVVYSNFSVVFVPLFFYYTLMLNRLNNLALLINYSSSGWQ